MTSFDVNHNGYLEINEQLYKAVGNLGVIIEDLNSALRNIPAAAWGGAQPIWLEYQTKWNAAYQEMVNQINATTVSSINVHEIFKQGDNRGAQIFIQ
jgi:hypothetical protein